MVVGTASGVGKSTVVSALCRAWARQEADVAPFKAQNMSNFSAVTHDGGEVGRAQAMQALAAGVEIDRRMNPVLLKPSGKVCHVVVLGDEVGTSDARGYGDVASSLQHTVLAALTGLRNDHRWVVAEGAGGAAEINLLDRDIVNLPLAAAAGVPAVLVADIDRGGAFAAVHGTLDLLPERLRRCVQGVVINRFRGDPSLLSRGISELEGRTGVPVLGVLPHLGDEPMLGVEDSLDLGAFSSSQGSGDPVRVAVVRLPTLANPADLDPLVTEPSVELRWAARAGDVEDVDLVVIPGSRATVADLAWLRTSGLAAAIAASDVPVIGLCAGYQMLGVEIHDDVESGVGTVPGLGLLPVRTRFARPKVVRRADHGYEIRWGRPSLDPDARSWLRTEHGPEGCVSPDGRVRGTSVHGVLDDDSLRHRLLREVASRSGRCFRPAAVGFGAARAAHLERLATWLGSHVDVDHLRRIASTATPPQEAPGW